MIFIFRYGKESASVGGRVKKGKCVENFPRFLVEGDFGEMCLNGWVAASKHNERRRCEAGRII